MEQMTAYSPDTQQTYPTWDDLVEAEALGYVVVSTSDRSSTSPDVHGLWPNRTEAKKAQARLRRKFEKEEHPYKVHVYVRILWKELP